ncbi:roadblock/LC7 domain-containing protein [Streptomyces sp. NPDC020096]
MTVATDVSDELRSLRARVPHLTGALAASVDGLVIAQDAATSEAESVAALTAAALGVGIRLADTAERGGFLELLVRGEQGYVAIYAAGSSAVVTVVAQARANVGRLHLEVRRSSARIAEIVEAALDRPDRS